MNLKRLLAIAILLLLCSITFLIIEWMPFFSAGKWKQCERYEYTTSYGDRIIMCVDVMESYTDPCFRSRFYRVKDGKHEYVLQFEEGQHYPKRYSFTGFYDSPQIRVYALSDESLLWWNKSTGAWQRRKIDDIDSLNPKLYPEAAILRKLIRSKTLTAPVMHISHRDVCMITRFVEREQVQ